MYEPVDLHNKKSSTLVIHCADPRFQAAYHKTIDDLDLYFDLLVMPGASRAIVDNPSALDYIKMLHDLHQFEEIHIMDHVECGAFGLVEDERQEHSACLGQAKAKIEKALPEIRTIPHLLGQKQELPVEV